MAKVLSIITKVLKNAHFAYRHWHFGKWVWGLSEYVWVRKLFSVQGTKISL